MTTQSIKVESASKLLSKAQSQKSKQATSPFDLFMGKNLSSAQSAQTTHPVAADKSAVKTAAAKVQKTNDKAQDKDDKTDNIQSYDVKNKDDVSKDSKTSVTAKENHKSSDTKDTADASKVADTKQMTETQTDNQTEDDELLAKFASMVNAIQELVMKLLNLTPMELNKLMTDQNMSATDLLQPENLMKLVLANNGSADITAPLTDEKLANTIKQLLSSADQIKSEAGLSITDDQVKDILQQIKANKADDTALTQQTAQDGTVVTVVNENKTIHTAKADTQTAKEQDGLTKEITVEVTKTTDTASNKGTQADAGNSNSKESTASQDSYQLFLDNLVKASQNAENDIAPSNATFSDLREIANQIIDRIKVVIKPNQTSMELQLNPDNLGKVNLNVQSKNGVMTAQFVVQNEISKEAIESQLNTLKETLSQQGIKVDSIEVTVAGYDFSQNSQTDTKDQMNDQKNQSKKKMSIGESQSVNEEAEVEENTTTDVTGLTGSSVDYTA